MYGICIPIDNTESSEVESWSTILGFTSNLASYSTSPRIGLERILGPSLIDTDLWSQACARHGSGCEWCNMYVMPFCVLDINVS